MKELKGFKKIHQPVTSLKIYFERSSEKITSRWKNPRTRELSHRPVRKKAIKELSSGVGDYFHGSLNEATSF